MLDWKSLHKTIDGAGRILLSTHENPDGDGLGSAYAMYHYLKSLGKDCRLVHISDCLLYTSPSPRDQRGSRMPGCA